MCMYLVDPGLFLFSPSVSVFISPSPSVVSSPHHPPQCRTTPTIPVTLTAKQYSMATRRVVVDDTDPRVKYTGTWTVDQGSQDSFGIYGPEYNHTLHGTSANNAGIAFVFNGTSIRVYGSMDTSDQSTPTWTCSVDQISIGSLPPQATSEHDNNFILCDLAQVADGQHTVTVNTTSSGHTFWFDYFLYTPSDFTDESLAGEVLQIQNQDPAITYHGSGWFPSLGIVNVTNTTGSEMTFQFSGTSATLVGLLPDGITSSGTYAVDSGSPITFTITGENNVPGGTLFNQILFTTPELSPSNHSLVVTYTGTSETTPLMVDYFYVTTPQSTTTTTTTTATTTTSSSSTSTSSAAVSSTSSSGSHKSKAPVGAIVGGVVGGLALLLLILGLLLRYKRTRNGNGTSPGASLEAQPFSPYAYTSMEGGEGGRQMSGLITELPSSLPSQSGSASGATGGSVVIDPYRLKYGSPTQATSPARPSPTSLSTQPSADGPQQSLATYSAPLRALKNEQTLAALSYPVTGSSSSGLSTQQPIIHTDSGVRLNRDLDPEPDDLTELPPVYAAD